MIFCADDYCAIYFLSYNSVKFSVLIISDNQSCHIFGDILTFFYLKNYFGGFC